MNRRNRHFLLLSLLFLHLIGCTSVSDMRPEVVRKGEYYLEHGVDAYANSDYVTATDFFQKALAQYRSIDDTHGVLLARINLAETAMATGNSQAVLNQLDAAEEVAQRSSADTYHKRLQLLRAQVYWRERDSKRVLTLIEPLLPQFDEKGKPEERPDLLSLTAVILRTDIAFSKIEEDHENAIRWTRRLEACLRSNDDTTPLHNARLNRFKALLAYRDGHVNRALEMLDQALVEYRQAAVRPAIAATLTETARLYMSMKKWPEAEERLRRALYVRVWILDRVGSREVLYLLAAVYDETDNREKAELSRQYAESISHGKQPWSKLGNELLR